MSVPSPVLQSFAEEITFLASQPFTPKPLVADILRTRYCIPGSIFLVEGVDIFQASKSKRWRGIRLLLGDGAVCIQALLAGEMHAYVDRGDVAIGTYVKLERFNLERIAPDADTGGKAKAKASSIAYLLVEDLVTVGWNNRLLAMLDAEEAMSARQEEQRQVQMPTGEVQERFGVDFEADFARDSEAIEAVEEAPKIPDPDTECLQELADADDDFEVMDVPHQKMSQKRAEIAAQRLPTDYSVPLDHEQLPWSSVDPTKPIKLTPLRSIPNLPYKQNWSTNVLAIIASISDLQSSTLPPYSQRIARLAHPSTPKQVHLTVFLDAPTFTPSVGSVVLLLGVKNHRFDGGSLKKYASDKPKNGGRWWFDNPVHLDWCDVEGLRRWWRQS